MGASSFPVTIKWVCIASRFSGILLFFYFVTRYCFSCTMLLSCTQLYNCTLLYNSNKKRRNCGFKGANDWNEERRGGGLEGGWGLEWGKIVRCARGAEDWNDERRKWALWEAEDWNEKKKLEWVFRKGWHAVAEHWNEVGRKGVMLELMIGMKWVGKEECWSWWLEWGGEERRNAGTKHWNEVGRKGGMLELRIGMRWVGKEECWS
jgi:hypothetical protein